MCCPRTATTYQHFTGDLAREPTEHLLKRLIFGSLVERKVPSPGMWEELAGFHEEHSKKFGATDGSTADEWPTFGM